MNNISDLKQYIFPGSKGHLIGIGGVSMSPLAEVLLRRGVIVSGSDIAESGTVRHLRSLGIDVKIGHKPENIVGVDFVVRTAAAHDDNPEIVEARKLGIPVFERAQAWGFIMQNYENALCISGTHGKTTTTSMATHIFMEAQKDPTVMIGGTLPLLHSGYRVGKGDTIILESCEYYNSFHSFCPTVAVILDVEADHLDFFKDLEDIKRSFRDFAALVPDDGYVVANIDDPNTMDALKGIDRRIVTFGLSEKADMRGVNIRTEEGKTYFSVLKHGVPYTDLVLNVPGQHNVLNALAACTAASLLGVSPEAIARGLAGFTGAQRRFEFKGTFNGARIYDDYAHHPGELHALLSAVSSLGYKRTIVAFQPHTFTRTKALFDDFVQELCAPDLVFLTEIYAAREKNTIGISSKDLADRIPGSVFCSSFDELEEKLRETAAPGDIILTVGAGNIYVVGENLVK